MANLALDVQPENESGFSAFLYAGGVHKSSTQCGNWDVVYKGAQSALIGCFEEKSVRIVLYVGRYVSVQAAMLGEDLHLGKYVDSARWRQRLLRTAHELVPGVRYQLIALDTISERVEAPSRLSAAFSSASQADRDEPYEVEDAIKDLSKLPAVQPPDNVVAFRFTKRA